MRSNIKQTAGVLAILLTTASPLFSQELPDEEALLDAVQAALPPWWDAKTFRTVAATREGNAASPRALLRFEAEVWPDDALLVPSGTAFGPIEALVPSVAAEEDRTLYGVMNLSYRAGEWTPQVTIENPVDQLGRPAEAFTGPVVVLGAEGVAARMDAIMRDLLLVEKMDLAGTLAAERAAVRAEHADELAAIKQANQLARETIEAASRDLARQIAALQDAHVHEVADMNAAHDQTLSEFVERAEAERTEAERRVSDAVFETEARIVAETEKTLAAHAVALDELAATQAEALKAAEREHEERLSAMRVRHSSEVAVLENTLTEEIAASEEALATARAAQDDEIAAMRKAHAATMGTLRARQAQEVAEAETGLEALIESLDRQLAESDTVLTRQEAVLARREEIDANEMTIRTLAIEDGVDRQALVASLAGTWVGRGDCTWKEEENVWLMQYTPSTILKDAVEGEFRNGNYGIDAVDVGTLLLVGEGSVLPLDLVLSLGAGKALGSKTVDLTLDGAGRLVGKSRDDICQNIVLTKQE